MNGYRLYHNPRCSKSRAALALLTARGIQPQLVAYLEQPPSLAELRQLLALLGLPARAVLRTGEADYAALGLADPGLEEDQLLAAMATHPILIERPILIRDRRAVIARPPERVLELLD
jgi:arsenate reductase